MEAGELNKLVSEFVHEHSATADQLLPLLHHIQAFCGCIPSPAFEVIAKALNISVAEVSGVVSFYTDFRTQPLPRLVDICCAEACQACGSQRLYDDVTDVAGPEVSVRKVFCLGNCAAAPTVRMGNTILARADLQAVQRELTKP